MRYVVIHICRDAVGTEVLRNARNLVYPDVDACLLSGLDAWKEGNNEKALEYMLMMDEYPDNHGYAHLEYYARDAQVYYNIGLAYEKVGSADKAAEYYEKAASVEVRPADAMYCYEKGLAMKKLDPGADVKKMYMDIVMSGESQVTEYFNTFFESFDRGPYEQDINSRAYYTQAVGYMAAGMKGKAGRYFRKALEERNDNLWAHYYLDKLDD